MCGRYVLHGPHSRLKERFDLVDCPEFAPRYNIAPTSEVLVVRQRDGVGRVAQRVRWGLVPAWAKDVSIGARLNNARAETVAEKPSFRNSFVRHRCLLPADGFYEWQVLAGGRKQPWYLSPAGSGDFLAMAGLLARWQAPDGTPLVSTCVITTAANELMAPIHERMPVILAASDWAAWLDPANHDTAALQALLQPAPAASLQAWRVAAAVGNARNDGEQLIAPLVD